VRIRAGGQHTGAAVDAAKKFIDLDLQCPPLDWGGAWGGIRARVPAASAFASPWLSAYGHVTPNLSRTACGTFGSPQPIVFRGTTPLLVSDANTVACVQPWVLLGSQDVMNYV